MTEGFAFHEIICGESMSPMITVSLMWTRLRAELSREADVIGKTHSEVLPGDWVKEYGNVAITGRPSNSRLFAGAEEAL